MAFVFLHLNELLYFLRYAAVTFWHNW